MLLLAALACKRADASQLDAIDACIAASLPPSLQAVYDAAVQARFTPFNPQNRRTQAVVQWTAAGGGAALRVTKGAPQTVLRLCAPTLSAAQTEAAMDAIAELADRGYRALGVAAGPVAGGGVGVAAVWYFAGIVPLFDPPRPDTRSTLEAAARLGIEVKMITGEGDPRHGMCTGRVT